MHSKCIIANPGRDINLWHAGYVQTYLERDVRTIRQWFMQEMSRLPLDAGVSAIPFSGL